MYEFMCCNCGLVFKLGKKSNSLLRKNCFCKNLLYKYSSHKSHLKQSGNVQIATSAVDENCSYSKLWICHTDITTLSYVWFMVCVNNTTLWLWCGCSKHPAPLLHVTIKSNNRRLINYQSSIIFCMRHLLSSSSVRISHLLIQTQTIRC